MLQWVTLPMVTALTNVTYGYWCNPPGSSLLTMLLEAVVMLINGSGLYFSYGDLTNRWAATAG